jgi:hypothetical protein
MYAQRADRTLRAMESKNTALINARAKETSERFRVVKLKSDAPLVVNGNH